MRVRESLILEESLLKKIDEIAGEKHRRAAVIETALREFIAREEKKARKAQTPPAIAKSAITGKR
jgi:metal-responsive CopG/Arc/MetJ family transcriptional regulator